MLIKKQPPNDKGNAIIAKEEWFDAVLRSYGGHANYLKRREFKKLRHINYVVINVYEIKINC